MTKEITHGNCPFGVLSAGFADAESHLRNMIALSHGAVCAIAKSPRLQARIGLMLASSFGADVATHWQDLMDKYTCCDSEAALEEAERIMEELEKGGKVI